MQKMVASESASALDQEVDQSDESVASRITDTSSESASCISDLKLIMQ